MDEDQPVGWQALFVDHVLRLPIANTHQHEAEIVRSIRNHRIPDALLNLSEPCLPVQVLLGEEFGICAPSRAAAEVGRDKYNMRRFAGNLGIPIPNFAKVTSRSLAEVARFQFPVIAKPVVGGGSTLVERFDSFSDLKDNFKRLQAHAREIYRKDSQISKTLSKDDEYPFMVEELVEGVNTFATLMPAAVGEFSVESVSFGGRTHVLAIHDKPLPANGPYFEEVVISTPTRMPAELVRQAHDYVTRIHNGLGPGGFVLHTEFRSYADRLVLLEFGIRLGGGPVYRSLKLSTRNDFIDILIALSRNETLTLSVTAPVPTISPLVFAPATGRITAIRGESHLVTAPTYIEHQIYDDIGDMAYRAPLSSRCNAHVVFQHPDWGVLERTMLDALSKFSFVVDSRAA
ncbi:ATP-grasp domain-containing protein [Bradyrhizobium prioriisuperbiae]|uniref:ATP-grasp domain-containing protein n=1 Tax=Bradyrhizobium prioriisuperbiae TaxID=2854389 RepID=UPI0028ECC20B|nr:ATP-grasp domain-containing protein [Bradyrhizobium prioritasuperba]